jgi:hypothetical protein
MFPAERGAKDRTLWWSINSRLPSSLVVGCSGYNEKRTRRRARGGAVSWKAKAIDPIEQPPVHVLSWTMRLRFLPNAKGTTMVTGSNGETFELCDKDGFFHFASDPIAQLERNTVVPTHEGST